MWATSLHATLLPSSARYSLYISIYFLCVLILPPYQNCIGILTVTNFQMGMFNNYYLPSDRFTASK